MTCYSWTLPATGLGGGVTVSDTSLDAAFRSLFGLDIWLDVSEGNLADRIVTADGDWRLVDGEEAVRQSLLRRTITNPGEWKTKPDYGVGARQFVKQRATQSKADELVTRIRGQYSRDKRVEKVLAVTVEWDNGLLRLATATQLLGRTLNNQPFVVAVQVR